MGRSLKNVSALILVGGLGTRLGKVINEVPKALAPISGRPFLSYIFDKLQESGIQNVILCTGYLGDLIENHYGRNYKDISINYSKEEEPLGTGGALRLAITDPGSTEYLVMNGDSFVDVDLPAFFKWHNRQKFQASIILVHVEDSDRYGCVEVNSEGKILAFHEKQKSSKPGWINAGVYLISRNLLDNLPNHKAISLEREILPQWITFGLGGFKTSARFIDIGTPESYRQAETFFTNHDEADQA